MKPEKFLPKSRSVLPSSSLGNLLLFVSVLLVTFSSYVTGKASDVRPIQFCKQDSNLRLDFCLAVQPLHNSSSEATDLYVTITRNHSLSEATRRAAHDEDAEEDQHGQGWLGIGIGPSMAGPLMIVVYHDPDSKSRNGVKTSIRTSPGHEAPEPVPMDSSGRPDRKRSLEKKGDDENRLRPQIRIARSEYDDSVFGQDKNLGRSISQVVIYSPNLWPDTGIDSTGSSQPWIWAHHPTQKLDAKESLTMHSHDKDKGYGFFWMDFKSFISSTDLSQIDASSQFPHPAPLAGPNTQHFTTTSSPAIYRLGGPSLRNWMWHLHGGLMSLSFLTLYPLGAILLRTSDSRAFNFHWTTQALSSVFAILAALLGYILSRHIVLVHQYLGLALLFAIIAQILLGWRHHIRFLRLRTGTWMGRAHVWLGRGILVLGWANLLLGLWQRGYGLIVLISTGVAIGAEAFAMSVVLNAEKRRKLRGAWFKGKRNPGTGSRAATGHGHSDAGVGPEGGLREEYFELVGEHERDQAAADADDAEADEDEDYDEDGRLRADVEWEDLMRAQGRLPGGGAGSGSGGHDRRGSAGQVQLVGGRGEDDEGMEDRVKRLARLDVV